MTSLKIKDPKTGKVLAQINESSGETILTEDWKDKKKRKEASNDEAHDDARDNDGDPETDDSDRRPDAGDDNS